MPEVRIMTCTTILENSYALISINPTCYVLHVSNLNNNFRMFLKTTAPAVPTGFRASEKNSVRKSLNFSTLSTSC